MALAAGPAQAADQAAQAVDGAEPGRPERLRAMTAHRWKDLAIYSVVALFVWYGWQRRGDVYLAPDEGAGYALGILGGSMLLMLLLYPLRKHAAWMRRFGHVRHWFRMHMLMGVIGPVCILFHCNFQLGSLNGNVALFSMLVVAISGIAGRYLYSRIHYGLYGSKASLARLSDDATTLGRIMQGQFRAVPEMREMLSALEQATLRVSHSLAGSTAHVALIAVRSRWVAWRVSRRLQRMFRQGGRQQAALHALARQYLRTYMITIRRVAGFTFYERLFSLWHVLHLPLFVMLLIAGVVHVVAVHVY